MDGISNLVGVKKVSREFNGRTYSFSLKVLADHAEKEEYLLSLKPDPFAVLAKVPADMDPQMRAAIADRITSAALKAQFASRIDESEFDASLHGLAWGIWRALRDNEEDFGRLKKGEEPVFTTPLGVGYSLTVAEGIQKTLDFIEAVGNARFAELQDIRDGVENPPELKN